MVRVGDFTVELVESDIKFPFSERTVNGITLVEAEPGSEYFIRLSSRLEEPVICTMSVDGKDLGYTVTLGLSGKPSVCGLWSFEKGRSIDRALKFAATGKVRVRFYHAIFRGYTYRRDHMSSITWQGESRKGTKTQTQKKNSLQKKYYVKGQQLGTVDLRYDMLAPSDTSST